MCTNPLKAFPIGLTENGKTKYKICSYKVDHIEETMQGGYEKYYDRAIHTYPDAVIREFVEIPCGKCLECRLAYARQWADRCMLEASLYDQNCFLTLTYDDINVPKCDGYDNISGEVNKYHTLRKEDLQLFIKRLRDHISRKEDIKIRYFAAGEYGEQTCRPHYHLIIFGWIPSDLKLLSMSNLGYALYTSPFINEIWPYGNNVVADCTWETCNYVARYQVKKLNGTLTDEQRKTSGIEKEFVLMSRRPGIGLDWFTSHNISYAAFSENYLKGEKGSIRIGSNRYFDNKLEEVDKTAYDEIKAVRKHFMEERKKIGQINTDLPYLEQKKIVADNLRKKTKILKGEL